MMLPSFYRIWSYSRVYERDEDEIIEKMKSFEKNSKLSVQSYLSS